MQVDQRMIGDVAILDVSGETDLYSSPTLRNSLLKVIEHRADGLPVLVNLSAVKYIDSSGLATLVEGLQKAKKKNMPFGLFGLTDHVMEVFRLARLDQIFKIYPDEPDAMNQVKGA